MAFSLSAMNVRADEAKKLGVQLRFALAFFIWSAFKGASKICVRAISSVGRASRLHRECRRFESVIAHHISSTIFRSSLQFSVLSFAVCLLFSAGAGFAQSAPAAHPMNFRLVPVGDPATCGKKCLSAIQAEGVIGKGTAEEFLAFVKDQPKDVQLTNMILIQSQGGVLEGAIKLGFVFRSAELMVIVAQTSPDVPGAVIPAQCYSACVYAVMGGTTRVIPLQSRMGIHAIFTNKFEFDPLRAESPYRKEAAGDNVNDVARKYAKEMGISTELVNLAETISPNTISILTPQQIRKFRLGVPSLEQVKRPRK